MPSHGVCERSGSLSGHPHDRQPRRIRQQPPDLARGQRPHSRGVFFHLGVAVSEGFLGCPGGQGAAAGDGGAGLSVALRRHVRSEAQLHAARLFTFVDGAELAAHHEFGGCRVDDGARARRRGRGHVRLAEFRHECLGECGLHMLRENLGRRIDVLSLAALMVPKQPVRQGVVDRDGARRQFEILDPHGTRAGHGKGRWRCGLGA